MILFSYLFQHFFSVFFLDKRFRLIFCFFSIVFFLSISFVKVDTYDIHSYVGSVGYAYIYEPFFYLIISFFSLLDDDSRIIVFYFQVFLFFLIISLVFYFKKNRVMLLSVVLCSVFTYLSVNNALRQGMASAFLLYSFLFILEKKYFVFFAFSMFAFFSHSSSILFSCLIIMIFLYGLIFYNRLSYFLHLFFLLLLGVCAAIILVNIVQYTEYSSYFGKSLTEGNERTPLRMKVIPIFMIFMVSEYLLRGVKINKSVDVVRFLRCFFIFFIFSCGFLSGLDEIGARLLFFYFGIEMLFMMVLVDVNRFRSLFSIIISYSFAFNVWNVIGV